MTLNELLVEWSYRTKKGYPDMGNPSDILVLKEILERLEIPTDILDELEDDEPEVTVSTDEPQEEPQEEPIPEPEEPQSSSPSTEYDELIKKTLNVNEIPLSENIYKYPGKGGGTYMEQVKEKDLPIWKALWEAKPEKKTEKGVETAGVGKGELSLYWLYHYSNSGVNVTEGRAGDDPDLFFNGNGVEVKAYSSHNAKLSIGRYGADKENLRLLGTIFGISTLARVFGGDGIDKTVNPTNFKGIDLIGAFEHVQALGETDLEGLSEFYEIFGKIKINIDFLKSKLEYRSAREGGLAMGRKFLKDKLGRKPGDGNFLVNLKKDGSMKFFNVSFTIIDSDDDILTKMGSSQSAMGLNFTKTFG